MTNGFYRIVGNRKIAKDIYEMKLLGDVPADPKPGQFLDIKIEGLYLRRPISVCDIQGRITTIIYRTRGEGTEKMSELEKGQTLDVLTGLGNGFDTSLSGPEPVLVGGGLGAAPLYFLCRKLKTEGKHPSVLLGFNSREESFLTEEFAKLTDTVTVYTADGSLGEKGFVPDGLKGRDYSYFYACGPEAMFRAMEQTVTGSGEYSFEEKMGCGFGACMGCTCKTKYGNKRICKDGPVLKREEVIW